MFDYTLKLLPINLALFDGADDKSGTQNLMNVNKTTSDQPGNNMSVEMKTFYSDHLIELAEAELVHDQFGQKHPIPSGSGKAIEFRKYDPLQEMTRPLDEGVTPAGQSLNVSKVEATVSQYGGYVTLSDMLILTAIDNNLVQATKLIASQAGRTLDTLTRDIINAGTVAQYPNGKTGRKALAATDILDVDTIKRAVRTLEAQDAPTIDGYYVGIIHPNAKYDLMKDPMWRNPHEYKDTTNVYRNEIGELYGVRFVQASRAKVIPQSGTDVPVDTYCTLIIADNAYGVTEVTGGGLQHIVKQLGDGGTSDPLNQRATVGWKATHTAEILVQQYLVRIESAASA